MFKENTDKKNLIISLAGFICWLVISIGCAQLNEYNTDELWAWNIASDLNFYEITQLMHYEGHSFLWYVILKPLTFLAENIPSIYPDALKIINMLFMAAAMFLLWVFAPFNNYIKALISVSAPFLLIYPSLARPYSLLILLVFIIAVLYKNRLKHPLIYTSLLFLTMQTCFNGVIIAGVLSGFFIFDWYQENKENLKSSKFLTPVFVILSSFLILLIEWCPVYPAIYVRYMEYFEQFREFMVPNIYTRVFKILNLLVYIFVAQIVLFINIISIKSKRWLLALFLVFNLMLIFYLSIAPGANYHLYFFYIYLIVLYWIMADNLSEFRENKPAYISATVFVGLLSILFFTPLREPHFWFLNKEQYKDAASEILDIIPQNSTVYMNLDFTQDLIIRLRGKYELRTQYGDIIPSYEAYKNLYQSANVMPDDMYIREGKNNYYIIAKQYTKKRAEMGLHDISKEFQTNPKCRIVDDAYYLCKLSEIETADSEEGQEEE